MIRGQTLLSLSVEELVRLNNTGMMPMPMTKDGRYDFSAMDKVYKKIGLPEWYALHGYRTEKLP